MTTTTTTNTNSATLAARAAGLFSKAGALGVVEKAIQQAVDARRVYPAMAQDYGAQLGHDLPLKTKDFIRVVGHLLASTEKPLKGVVSKKKSEILLVLSEIVGALTATDPMALPLWAFPKGRAKTADAEELAKAEKLANAEGALNKANMLAEAEANAAKAEAAQEMRLAQAIDLVVTKAAQLTEAQRRILLSALASAEAEATEAAEA